MWDASRRPSRIPMMDIPSPEVSIWRSLRHMSAGIKTYQQTVYNNNNSNKQQKRIYAYT